MDLEALERSLTVLEEKLFAALTAAAPEDLLVGLKEHAARELAPYRSRMGAVQMRQVERQFVQKQLLASLQFAAVEPVLYEPAMKKCGAHIDRKQLAGAKALSHTAADSARLKPCPDTKRVGNRGRARDQPMGETPCGADRISRSRFTAARFWRTRKARRCLCRFALPGEQARVRIVEDKRGYATAEVEEIVDGAPAADRARVSGTLARVGAASISMRTMRRSSYLSRQSCARRWSAAAFARRKRSRYWPRSRGRIAIASGWRSTRMETRDTAGGGRTR